jgi:mitotic spindle assembly checkpoint protein MAD1
MSGRLKEIRQQNGQLSNSLAQLESEHAQLSNQHSGLSLNTSREIDLLTSRLREVEAERDGLRGWERRARGLSIDLEEARRKAEENRRGQEDEVAEHKMDDTIRKELKRTSCCGLILRRVDSRSGQAQYLVSLERNHAALKTEMIDLRQKRKETDANERATKDVERALRDEIRSLQEQLDRARRDMECVYSCSNFFTDTGQLSDPNLPFINIFTRKRIDLTTTPHHAVKLT